MQTFIIGRDATSQIVLNDDKVSRRHAQLTILDNGQVMIKDLGSVNGTYVNGNRITEIYLNSGDIVKCGPVFLNWSQYTNLGTIPIQQRNYQQPVSNQAFLQEPGLDSSATQYKLGDVFKYLATRIFEIGDLFKTNWDKTSSILFLNGVPVILTFVATFIIYLKIDNSEFYFSPTILALLQFSICPFIAMYLLSLKKKVQIDKVALSSGIVGFIHFSITFFLAVLFWIYYQQNKSNYGNLFSNYFELLFTIILAISAIICIVILAIAFYLFIYKYFISIGVDRSKSIYLVIISCGINLFFQILSSYVIFLIAKDTVSNFNF